MNNISIDHWVNKVAVVTGASSGIGRAIAEKLVHHGMKVVGIARRVDKMKMMAEEWKSKSGKLIPMQCDLANENEIMRVMDWIEKNLGVVEILINNAAVDMPSLVSEGGMDEWKKSLDINVLSVVLMIKEMLRMLKKKGLNHGIIINMNDICAWPMMKGRKHTSASYHMTKHALRGLTDYLRMELARMQSNIKVINIMPSLVDTAMSEHHLTEKPRMALKPKDVAEVVMNTIQTPEHVLIQDVVITPIRDVMMM